MTSTFVDSWANYMGAGLPFVQGIEPMVLWFMAFVFGFGVIRWAVSAVQAGSSSGVRFPTGGDTRKGG